jgi:Zn-dependent M28 family amino/carboxypeptidase
MIGSPNHVFFVYDGDDSDGVGAGPGPPARPRSRRPSRLLRPRGEPYKGTDFSGRSDYGPFIALGIPSGGLFTGAEGIKTPEEAAIWGGTAGQYDPCYHLACDTYDNNNLHALDVNADAVAYATLTVRDDRIVARRDRLPRRCRRRRPRPRRGEPPRPRVIVPLRRRPGLLVRAAAHPPVGEGVGHWAGWP